MTSTDCNHHKATTTKNSILLGKILLRLLIKVWFFYANFGVGDYLKPIH